jgi:prolyl-tRNA synthetase
MLWSKLFIPTLREDHPLAIRAGYMRKHDYLFLGRRVLSKIETVIRDSLLKIEGREFLAESLAALASHAREIRGAKQLPQIWYQFNGFQLQAIAFGATPFAPLSRHILKQCGVTEIGAPVEEIVDSTEHLSPEPFHTPDQKSIADVAAFTGAAETSQMKSVVMNADGAMVLALMRGDHQLDESKLKLTMLAKDVRPATAGEIRKAFGADAGSLGPIGLSNVAVLCDEALRGRRNLICGANRNDYHLRNVTPGKDFEARFFDLRATEPRSVLQITRAASTDAELMTISLDRLLAAAIGQNRDADGIVLPCAIAPFAVVVTPVLASDETQMATALEIYRELYIMEIDTILDDRDERPGVKFKDSDLIGIPYRITVGKKLPQGIVEVVTRRGRTSKDVRIEDIVSCLHETPGFKHSLDSEWKRRQAQCAIDMVPQAPQPENGDG